MSIVFLTQCCVDGCYKKKKSGSPFCKAHDIEFWNGKELSVCYGKKAKLKQPVEHPAAEIKPINNSTECESARRV